MMGASIGEMGTGRVQGVDRSLVMGASIGRMGEGRV